MKTLAILLPALALAACGKGDGTTVSITGDNGSAGIVNGTAKIDVPGFKGEVTLPKFQIDASHLDIDGVKLFPGSTVRSVNVNAHDSAKDDGTVKVAFDAPASGTAVRDYFRTELGKAGFTVADDGTGLTGKTKDGKPFTLSLGGGGADRTSGELSVGG